MAQQAHFIHSRLRDGHRPLPLTRARPGSSPNPHSLTPRMAMRFFCQVGTGNDLPLTRSVSVTVGAHFEGIGNALGGVQRGPIATANKWAPENFEQPDGTSTMLFSTPHHEGEYTPHRMVWAQALNREPGDRAWTSYSPVDQPLDLGGACVANADRTLDRPASRDETAVGRSEMARRVRSQCGAGPGGRSTLTSSAITTARRTCCGSPTTTPRRPMTS